MKLTKQQKLDQKKLASEHREMMRQRIKVLSLAIEINDIPLAKAIIENVEIDYNDDKCRYHLPLDMAVRINNLELVACLLAKGADPNTSNFKQYMKPINDALGCNRLDMAQLLFDHGAKLTHDTNLNYASYHITTLEWILKTGYDPNSLMQRVYRVWGNNEDEKIVKARLLLKYGADVSIVDVEEEKRNGFVLTNMPLHAFLEKQRKVQLRRVMYKSMFGKLPKEVFGIVESFLYS